MRNIAIFASGTGSNARKIIEYFKQSPEVRVALVVSNKKDAGVLDIAQEHGIPTRIINRQTFYESEEILDVLRIHHIDVVVLAGFLWLVPPYLVRAFPRRMVNIHPALLPRHGGKGMYGIHVHEAVKSAGDSETGITIHFVNEHYDEGDFVFQERCAVDPEDSPSDIARKVLQLEHRYFPEVIAQVVASLPQNA
ncbi:MAG: phosphoribosylglycinamide formyltransferase [Lewinellaceae bacterium]|nr:phosphoribosylglycinamide formyltransferase [Lewinellaceae bacterium]